MYSVQATGGPPAVLFDNEPGIEIDFHDPTWLPDGRLLFAAHRDLSEPEASGDGSRDAGGDDLEIMEIGLFDGDRREVVDLGMSGNLKFLVYDHLSEHLVYTRNNPSPGVWVIPVERGDLSPAGGEFLIAPNGWTVSLDDGGSMLYVEGAMTQSSNELVKLDRSGRLTSVVAAALPGLAEPSVSPDARYIAVTAEGNESRDVWIVDLERGSDLRLTFDDVDATTPAWFPSSREIMYSEIKGMSSDIVSRSIDGSGRRTELVPGTGYGLWSGLAQMSPDGRLLVYAIDVDGPTYLHVSDIGDDGSLSDARPLFSLEENPSVLDARVSPSGELLAYMTTDSGQPEVFLTRFPSGEGRWQVSKDGGRMPRWSSESGELFFVSGSGPGQRMLTRVEIGSGPEVVLGEPIALFEIDESAGVASIGAGFDVLPDGVEFIFVRREGGSGSPSQRLILVQNWIREFGAAE